MWFLNWYRSGEGFSETVIRVFDTYKVKYIKSIPSTIRYVPSNKISVQYVKPKSFRIKYIESVSSIIKYIKPVKIKITHKCKQ